MNLKNKLILAPMAEVNNIAFRLMCKQYGADIIFSEMLSANALSRKNPRTLGMTRFENKEKPFIIQLFGAKPENFMKAAKILVAKGCDGIDINLGCPSKKILDQGAGASLLKRTNKVKEIIEALTKNIDLPISAKIRTVGSKFDDKTVKLAKIIEDAGASFITVHARTTAQGYSGKADWDVIKAVKETVSIPVVGNGDVKDSGNAQEMYKQTGCDSIMIGRAAIGNPYIFRQIKENIPMLSEEQRKKMFFTFLKLYKKYYGPNLFQLKMNAQWFTKSIKGAAKIRDRISRAKEVKEILENF